MNKIINGKRYDTDTATKLSYSPECMDTNKSESFEDLYRTASGDYFKYSWDWDTHYGFIDRELVPLTLDEAKAFAEIHCSADEYEAEFGVVEETDSTLNMPVYATTVHQLDFIASESKKSKIEIMKDLVETAYDALKE